MNTTTKQPILCIGFTPALQRTLTFERVTPGDVNRAKSAVITAAGKGVNASHVMKALGSEPLCTGFIGGSSGRFIDEELQKRGIACAWIETEAPTRNCHTVIDQTGHTVTELVEESATPTETEWSNAFEVLETCISQSRYAGILGALPPGSPSDIYARIVRLCASHNVPCLLDSQKQPLLEALPEKPFGIKMNTDELGTTLNQPMESEDEVLAGMRAMHERGAKWVMITKGPEAVWLMGENTSYRFTPPTIQAVNPIGSGDSALAGMLHALNEGHGMVDAVKYGIACGTANALTPIAGNVRVEDVERLVELVSQVSL